MLIATAESDGRRVGDAYSEWVGDAHPRRVGDAYSEWVGDGYYTTALAAAVELEVDVPGDLEMLITTALAVAVELEVDVQEIRWWWAVM